MKAKLKSILEWTIKIGGFIFGAAAFFKTFGAKALSAVVGAGITAAVFFA